MRFGITERGDAALDRSWTGKLDKVVGAILITKNVLHNNFWKTCLMYSNKIIIHATITGMGGTTIEPYVPPYMQVLSGVNNLIVRGFPAKQIVVRIDPIIPIDGPFIDTVDDILNHIPLDITRVRYSFIDYYPHVKARGLKLPWDSFHPPIEQQQKVIEIFKKYPRFEYESCGEDHAPAEHQIGCISQKDLDILGIDMIPMGRSKQRKSCKCIGNKYELLTSKSVCYHQCMYCYWKG